MARLEIEQLKSVPISRFESMLSRHLENERWASFETSIKNEDDRVDYRLQSPVLKSLGLEIHGHKTCQTGDEDLLLDAGVTMLKHKSEVLSIIKYESLSWRSRVAHYPWGSVLTRREIANSTPAVVELVRLMSTDKLETRFSRVGALDSGHFTSMLYLSASLANPRSAVDFDVLAVQLRDVCLHLLGRDSRPLLFVRRPINLLQEMKKEPLSEEKLVIAHSFEIVQRMKDFKTYNQFGPVQVLNGMGESYITNF